MALTAKELLSQLESAQTELGGPGFPCTRKVGDQPCTQQYERKFDRQGRPVFYFSTGCKVVEKFCPACLAYWHVAVARNLVIEVERWRAQDEAEQARSSTPGERSAVWVNRAGARLDEGYLTLGGGVTARPELARTFASQEEAARQINAEGWLNSTSAVSGLTTAYVIHAPPGAK